MKRLLAACLVLLAGAVQFGLASGQAEPVASTGPVTLKILWWGGQARHDKTLKVLDLHQAAHPNVSFEPTYIAWTEYWDKLAALAAAEDLPDIYQNVHRAHAATGREGSRSASTP